MITSLRKVTDRDFPVINNLVPYYVYEMSGEMGWDPNTEGCYGGCDDLRDYWEKPDYCAYVIAEYTNGDFTQTAEQYVCPYSGTWDMQFYRFATRNQGMWSGGV